MALTLGTPNTSAKLFHWIQRNKRTIAHLLASSKKSKNIFCDHVPFLCACTWWKEKEYKRHETWIKKIQRIPGFVAHPKTFTTSLSATIFSWQHIFTRCLSGESLVRWSERLHRKNRILSKRTNIRKKSNALAIQTISTANEFRGKTTDQRLQATKILLDRFEYWVIQKFISLTMYCIHRIVSFLLSIICNAGREQWVVWVNLFVQQTDEWQMSGISIMVLRSHLFQPFCLQCILSQRKTKMPFAKRLLRI